MGMTPVAIDDRTRVHVKDSAASAEGWHLWMSLYVDGEFVDGDAGAVVQDLGDSTIERAAREWYASRPSR